MTYLTKDRRATRRRSRTQEHGIVRTRVRPGIVVTLIDVSAGGVLVEGEHRLLPGSRVELQVESASRRACLRGRVLRCAVVRLRPDSIFYRGAIVFEQYLPWFADEDGYDVPNIEKRPAAPFRAEATPRVV